MDKLTTEYEPNEPRFNNVYLRNNLPKVTDRAYIINKVCEPIETHWMPLHVNGSNMIYFDSFRFEHIPKEIIKLIINKNVITIIYRIETNDSVTCEYFYTGFINLC